MLKHVLESTPSTLQAIQLKYFPKQFPRFASACKPNTWRLQKDSAAASKQEAEHVELQQSVASFKAEAAEEERLQLEIQRLQPFEVLSKDLEARLAEVHLQLEQSKQAHQHLYMESEALRQRLAEVGREFEAQRSRDAARIRRLQADLESIRGGESQAEQEPALPEKQQVRRTARGAQRGGPKAPRDDQRKQA